MNKEKAADAGDVGSPQVSISAEGSPANSQITGLTQAPHDVTADDQHVTFPVGGPTGKYEVDAYFSAADFHVTEICIAGEDGAPVNGEVCSAAIGFAEALGKLARAKPTEDAAWFGELEPPNEPATEPAADHQYHLFKDAP
jgi:hypothetical protein